MNLNKGFFTLFIALLCLNCWGQRFVENGGQWPEQVLFSTDIPGGRLYLENNRLLFDRYDTETTSAVFAGHTGNPNPIPPPEMLQCHAYAMALVNANFGQVVIGDKPANTKYNYFIGNNPEKWGTGLRGFESVTYREVYAGVDLKVYRNATLKYDFILAPGADPDEIEIVYEGVKPKHTKQGQLLLNTTVGEILESRPFAYQIIDGGISPVDCEYIVSGKKVSFKLGDYRTDLELIIDPELIFSTYSGSEANNFGYTATYGPEGHLYSGSSVFGIGYPTTTGAYQESFSGGIGTDIGITKFSLDGTDLEYSSYIGGTREELPHSLIVDESGILYVFGTSSSDDYALTDNAFQTEFLGGTNPNFQSSMGVSYANGSDIVISKLSVNGDELLGSTYLGGDSNDGLNTSSSLVYNYADEIRGEIELNPEGNVIIGTCTQSDNFPVPDNAFQPNKNSGQDGVIIEMNSELSNLVSSTFLGGEGSDAIYSIHSTPNGFVTVTGGTTSDDLPSTTGAFQEDFAGGRADGFIAAFPSGLSSIHSMTYYGSSAYDQIYFVDRDEAGNPHIFGQTEATDDEGSFIFNADYAIPNSGMLLTKFTPDLEARAWSTVFGVTDTKPNISPTAFSVDICNRVYLSGWGGSTNNNGSTTDGLEVTDDAIQSTTDGSDFYFLVLEDDASNLTFATFFGGNESAEHVDGGTSRFDRAGKIYQAVCAGCQNNDDFPTGPGNIWSNTNNSTGCNLGVAKIDFDLPLSFADFSATESCLPDSTAFLNTSDLHSDSEATYQWFIEDDLISTEENPSFLFPTAGTFEIKLVVIDANSCNITDTIVKPVIVYPAMELNINDEYTSCTEDTFEIIANANGSSDYFEWSENIEFTDIILEGDTDSTLTYTTDFQHEIFLRISNEHCEVVDTILVSPAPSILLSTADTLICQEMEFNLSFMEHSGTGINQIIWTPEDNIISGQGTQHVVFDALSSFNAQVQVFTEFGCELNAGIQVDVFPTYLEVTEDTLACENMPIDLTANSSGSAQDFVWSNQTDFSVILNPTGDSTITIIPTSIQYYYALVENNGCFLKDSVAVSLLSAGTTVSNDQYICESDTTSILVTNDFPGSNLHHTWQPDEYILSGQNTPLIHVLIDEPTTFTVWSETDEGCVVENSSTVYLSPLGVMEVDAVADPIHILEGESSILNSTPVIEEYLYQWTPVDGLSNPNGVTTVSTPEGTTTYYITITDFNDLGACLRSDSVTVYVYESVCSEPNIFVPNTFTPNGDGENDQLWVRGGEITSLDFAVYNRWGEKVFETQDQSQGWDGTFKGDLAEPAVYVYYLTVDCDEGEQFFKKGNVTLLR